jgi:hypothetical protein
MSLYQNKLDLVQIRQRNRGNNAFSEPFINTILISRLKSQGVSLLETNIEVLDLGRGDLIKLGDAGIVTLEQLSSCIEMAVATIPHFGKIKISRLKAKVYSYLTSLLNGGGEGFDLQYGPPEVEIIEKTKSIDTCLRPSSISHFIADLEGD